VAGVDQSLVDTVVALLGTAVIGGVAWLMRSWANGLSSDISDLKTEVKEEIKELREDIGGLKDDVAQMKVVVGWPPQLRRTGH
jgi:hypothetical protein